MKIVAHRSQAVLFGLMTLVLLALFVLAAGCFEDNSDVTYPTPPKAPSKIWMFDVFGTAEDNVYACGYGGAMFHFDGTGWTEVDLGTTRNVVSIWGPGDGTLYACGGAGSIWRNSGSGWNSMDSDASNYLVGIGSFEGDVHVCGVGGTLLKLSGSTWNPVNSSMIIRDPMGAPTDTLSRVEDIESLVTVNHYFVGGAYRLKAWQEDEVIGTEFTDGMVIGPDLDFPDEPEYGRFDWQLRPLRGDEIAASEWVQSSTSDDEILGNNYLGTTEGWVFQLTRNDQGRLVWSKKYPRITSNPRSGINDMWLDANGNLYMITHEGQLVFQTHDYDVNETTYETTGYRVIQSVSSNSLTGLWASDPDHIFVVGLVEKTVFRYRYDSLAQEFVEVATDTLQYSGKSAAWGDGPDAGLDRFGRPLEP